MGQETAVRAEEYDEVRFVFNYNVFKRASGLLVDGEGHLKTVQNISPKIICSNTSPGYYYTTETVKNKGGKNGVEYKQKTLHAENNFRIKGTAQ